MRDPEPFVKTCLDDIVCLGQCERLRAPPRVIRRDARLATLSGGIVPEYVSPEASICRRTGPHESSVVCVWEGVVAEACSARPDDPTPGD